MGYSPVARLYAISDDEKKTYAVMLVEHKEERETSAWVVVMARITDGKVVIEEDTTDKPLVDALMVNGDVPREQIVLAYAGETAEKDNDIQ